MGAHLFSEMRYELNGVEIDRCKNPGITSLMKLLVATKTTDKASLSLYKEKDKALITDATYRIFFPLRFVFGFCDDFNKIVMNSKNELILMRNRTDLNAYTSSKANVTTLKVTKIAWKMPHVTLSDRAKLTMLKTLDRNDSLPLAYRSWELYELPKIPSTNRHSWTVKASNQVTKPRYVVVAFQTNRSHSDSRSASDFDHCNITDVKLYLNNERYPYGNLHSNFSENQYHELFHQYTQIQDSYNNKKYYTNPSQLNYTGFLSKVLFTFDCSRSEETIKSGVVDLRVEIEASGNIADNTAAYCLIIRDNLVRYSPFSSIVHRDI